ncbi:hypothetical protein AB5J72_45350 [Streptomyces sp. CG1]
MVTSAPGMLVSAVTGSTLALSFGDLAGTAGATRRVTVRLG